MKLSKLIMIVLNKNNLLINYNFLSNKIVYNKV